MFEFFANTLIDKWCWLIFNFIADNELNSEISIKSLFIFKSLSELLMAFKTDKGVIFFKTFLRIYYVEWIAWFLKSIQELWLNSVNGMKPYQQIHVLGKASCLLPNPIAILIRNLRLRFPSTSFLKYLGR